MLQIFLSIPNPYAWDYIHEDGRLSNDYVDEIYFMTNLNWYSKLFLFCVDGFASSLLFLVLFHSTGQLKSYRRMLLLCCTCDWSYWLIESIVQWVRNIWHIQFISFIWFQNNINYKYFFLPFISDYYAHIYFNRPHFCNFNSNFNKRRLWKNFDNRSMVYGMGTYNKLSYYNMGILPFRRRICEFWRNKVLTTNISVVTSNSNTH